MRAHVRVALLVTAVALVILGAASVRLLGGDERDAQARGGSGGEPTILGLDMDPFNGGGNGTSLPRYNPETGVQCLNSVDDDVADDTQSGEDQGVVNDGCGLGDDAGLPFAIDQCISVASGATFWVDIFLDDIPTGGNLGGFGGWLNFDNTKLDYLGPGGGNFSHNFLLMRDPDSDWDLINLASDETSRIAITAPDIYGPDSAEQPGEYGVLGRYKFQALAAGPAYTSFTLTGPSGHFKLVDWNGVEIAADQVWDGVHSPQYGIVAIGTGCPPNSDSDGWYDPFDNCPFAANPAQADSDHDGLGDVCDPVGTLVGIDVNPSNSGGNGTSLPRHNPEIDAQCLNSSDDDFADDTQNGEVQGVVNDGCGLGDDAGLPFAIDQCISVASGATFWVDIFLDDIPTGRNFGGFTGYLNFDNTKLDYLGPGGGNFSHKFLLMRDPESDFLLSYAVDEGAANQRINILSADMNGSAAAEQAGEYGVLGRYKFQALAVGPAFTALTLSGLPSFKLVDSGAVEIVEDQVWDGIHGPQYGIVAIGTGCPSDSESDGWLDPFDNCPQEYNPDQFDSEQPPDGLGDVCDPDTGSSSAVSGSDGSVSVSTDTGTIAFDGTTADPNRTVTIQEDTGAIGTIEVASNGESRVSSKFDLLSTSLLTGTATKVTDFPAPGISQGQFNELTVTKKVTGGSITIPHVVVSTQPLTEPYTQVTVSFDIVDDATFTVLVPADTDSDGVYDRFDADGDGDFVDPGEVDNCPTAYNPDQTNTDGHDKGDACDVDNDDDGYKDTEEDAPGGNPDPLLIGETPEVCDGDDDDGDTLVDEGFPDSPPGLPRDCMDSTKDDDGDTIGNGADTNDDNFPNADPFIDVVENYLGTNRGVTCAVGTNDNDPLDNTVDTIADVSDVLRYVATNSLNTAIAADSDDYWRRGDLTADRVVDVSDILRYVAYGVLNLQCPYGL